MPAPGVPALAALFGAPEGLQPAATRAAAKVRNIERIFFLSGSRGELKAREAANSIVPAADPTSY